MGVARRLVAARRAWLVPAIIARVSSVKQRGNVMEIQGLREDAGVADWTPAYERRAVALLTIGFGLVGLDRWIVAPLGPSMIADLGLTPQNLNNLIAALGVSWGIAAVLLGGLSDRVGRKEVLIPSLLAFSLMSSLSGMVSGLAALFVARGLMGVAEGAFCPTSFASTAEASHPKRRGFNQGLQQSAFALFGLGFGPILATQMLAVFSWRVIFLLVAIPGLILTALLASVIREPRPIARPSKAEDANPDKPRLADLFAHRNVALAMAGLFCAMCGIFVLSANIPLYLTGYLKLTPAQMGIVTSAIGFGGFAGQWGLPAVSDHIGRRITAIIGFVAGTAFLFWFTRIGADTPVLFTLLFVASAFSFGLLSLLTGPVATEAAPAGRISSTAGLIIGAGEIFGGGLALVVSGIVIGHFGIQAMLYVALGGLSVGGVLMAFLKETAPRLTDGRPHPFHRDDSGLSEAEKAMRATNIARALENSISRHYL